MSQNIVVTFALWFGATISLICAVYVYLINRRTLKEIRKANQEKIISE